MLRHCEKKIGKQMKVKLSWEIKEIISNYINYEATVGTIGDFPFIHFV